MPPASRELALALVPRVFGALLALWLLWHLREVVLLCFAAVVIATLLHALALPIAKYTRMPVRLVILVLPLLLLGVLATAFWLAGPDVLQQLQTLQGEVPRAWSALLRWLQGVRYGPQVLEWLQAADLKVPWAKMIGFASASAAGAGNVLLALLLGIYLALDVGLYRAGLLRLVPQARRAEIDGALADSGSALRRWLIGQGLTMLIVGVTVGVGLALLGMPLAAAIGLISGLFEFVPFFGAIAWAVLAVLLAFAQGPERALYVAIFCVALQQLEGNVVIPMVQRWTVHLPPVLSLLAVVVFGRLFGVEGVVLGTPLMVVTVALLQRMWVPRMG